VLNEQESYKKAKYESTKPQLSENSDEEKNSKVVEIDKSNTAEKNTDLDTKEDKKLVQK
jgi:hypothetical protein